MKFATWFLEFESLAVQMANGIYENTPDRAECAIRGHSTCSTRSTLFQSNTDFNDIALLDGTFSAVTIQAGNTTAETISNFFC